MLDNEILAAVKGGMKGELDSVTIYEDAAGSSTGKVKEFFLERAAEEKQHFNYLLGYYKTRTINLTPERDAAAEIGGSWKSSIMSEAFLKQIAASKHLSAAIASAVHLEADAVRHYSDWAARAESPELKKLLGQLVAWEQHHYDDLTLMQDEMQHYYFEINNFEPF